MRRRTVLGGVDRGDDRTDDDADHDDGEDDLDEAGAALVPTHDDEDEFGPGVGATPGPMNSAAGEQPEDAVALKVPVNVQSVPCVSVVAATVTSVVSSSAAVRSVNAVGHELVLALWTADAARAASIDALRTRRLRRCR